MTIPLHLVHSGHWGTIFDHTSPFGAIRSLRYNIWPYLYLTIPLHLVHSGHWVQYLTIPLHLVLLRSLRYNIWPYLSIWCTLVLGQTIHLMLTVQYLTIPLHLVHYQVTEVQYLTIPLHLVAIRSLRYNIWPYLSHLVLSGHGGTIFDHTSPFVTIRSLRYSIWPYLSIWCYQVTEVQYLIIPLHLVLSGH